MILHSAPPAALLHCCRYIVSEVLRQFDAVGVDMAMFAPQWFMTLFVYLFPTSLVLRIWDIFLLEGWKTIYRVGIALIKWKKPQLKCVPNHSSLSPTRCSCRAK